MFDIEGTLTFGYELLFGFYPWPFLASSSIELYEIIDGAEVLLATDHYYLDDPNNLSALVSGLLDNGSSTPFDPMLEYNFVHAGRYVVRIGSYVDHYPFGPSNFFGLADGVRGVVSNSQYELVVSLQRHDTNPKAISLVNKDITILTGEGRGLQGRIVSYGIPR